MASTSTSPLPPLSSKGVLTVSESTIIDAPVEKVWEILTDFPKYKEWNPFVRAQTMVSKTTGKPLDNQSCTVGEHMKMYPVHIPPTMDDSSVWLPSSSLVIVTHVDHTEHRCAWRFITTPAWLLTANRWQTVTKMEEGGGTKYESIEVFEGLASWILKWFMAANLGKSVKAMGEALKQRAEDATWS